MGEGVGVLRDDVSPRTDGLSEEEQREGAAEVLDAAASSENQISSGVSRSE